QLLDQSRRALVRGADDEMDQAKRPSLRPRSRRLDPHLDHQLERRPKALRLAQNRRRDPRQPRLLLPADQRLRSLGALDRGARVIFSDISEECLADCRAIAGDGAEYRLASATDLGDVEADVV